MFYWTGVSVKGTDCVNRLRFVVSRWCCVFKQLSFADDISVPYTFMPARGACVVMMYVDDEETPRRVWRMRPPRAMVINLDVNKRIDVIKMDIDDMREMVAGKNVDVVDV